MKKIIIAFTMLVFGTVSAHAIDRSIFSVTAGIAANQGVFGASAKETNLTDTNTTGHVKKESGVFTDSFGSQFLELGIGEWISLGYEHTPDSVTTPTNTSRHGHAAEANVSVDFNDLNTTYLRVNLPFAAGMYAKVGTVSTDLDIKETMGSGSTYSNVSTDGNVMGLGYHKFINDSRIGLRIEGSYLELDNVSTSNGVSATGATVANGGRNTIDASNLEGLTAKIALTITLGKD
ncbi:hypothetical protein IDG58_03410 [Pelagibacterales bacterium SAG-MED19]|nr:hypothetical protein [Pelagibacterales bacterium SAG-MED19]